MIVAVGCLLAGALAAEPTELAKDDKPHPFARKFPLPPEALDGGTAWLNTAGPMPLPKLRGKIVLLDFWTFCCINCIHILADLEKLEAEFPNELVVIGVHSPKFLGEQDSDNIRSAVMRYGIKHPIVNDSKMALWQRFGANSWPTLVLIDAEGAAVRLYSGEGHYEDLRADIRKLIDYHTVRKTLDREPIHVQNDEMTAERTPLRFPGKVVVDPAKNRIFIADSSHHRLVVAELSSGKLLETIGDGTPALTDGDFRTARFNDPQGMAVDGDKLWLADRKNHALRLVDFAAKKVTTVAGNGTRGFERNPGEKGTKAALASPWDVLIVDGVLYIAMAGTHQIWSMKLTEPGNVQAFAGNGRENIRDGFREEANFAQPSGLASDGEWLYVADSETSSIRAVGLKQDAVKSLVGSGLFEFGDVDGPGREARLQHALGVALVGKTLYVADTYNNKIKTIDAKSNVAAWLGDVKPGRSDNPARFDEPGGIHFAGGKLYLADTNNHAIRVIDPETKKTTTFTVADLEPPAEKTADDLPKSATIVKSEKPLTLASEGGQVTATLETPKDAKLNAEAPVVYRVWSLENPAAPTLLKRGRLPAGASPAKIPLDAATLKGAKSVRVAVNYFVCEAGSEGVCRSLTRVWEFVVESKADGPKSVELPAK